MRSKPGRPPQSAVRVNTATDRDTLQDLQPGSHEKAFGKGRVCENGRIAPNHAASQEESAEAERAQSPVRTDTTKKTGIPALRGTGTVQPLSGCLLRRQDPPSQKMVKQRHTSARDKVIPPQENLSRLFAGKGGKFLFFTPHKGKGHMTGFRWQGSPALFSGVTVRHEPACPQPRT